MKTLRHIDNNFYYVSPRLAKAIGGGSLPRPGYEREIAPQALAEFQTEKGTPATKARRAILKRTGLSYWDGKPVKSRHVWALHLCW